MKISTIFSFFILVVFTTSFQLSKTKHLTGKDFDSLSEEYASSIRLREGKFERLLISDIYADRIFLVSSLSPSLNDKILEANRIGDSKKPNRYRFEMDIHSLKKGDYILRTSACYWVGELHLIIF